MAERQYRGVIFDMDGVLADSEPCYQEATATLLGQYGASITPEEHKQVMAGGPREAFSRVLQFAGIDQQLSIDDFLDQFEPIIIGRLSGLAETLPGATSLVRSLRDRGVPIAVASSSKVTWIRQTLSAIGLAESFDAIVSGTEVSNPKPAPDVYLEAARRIGIAAEDCIAIEDTPTGLRSVKAAGMLAVQVRSSSVAFPPQPEADLVIESLTDFDLSLLTSQGHL